jgi:formate dehydrogenase iron-sulfur subunit
MSEPVGFFTDTTVCIGCKACQVACHQWNDLPAARGERTPLPVLSGQSYDNTTSLSDVNWRHVKFIEKIDPDRSQMAWLMMSDVCKHCVNAPCLEVCPTGAILRTEFDTVYINEPACNGCRDCITACPFGVIHVSETKHIAQKCTFCYDRLKNNLVPACAQACPTQSIRFGPVRKLQQIAQERVAQLQQHGQGIERDAYLYGADDKILGGLNAFYLLVDKPETYGLPSNPQVPSRSVFPSSLWSILASILTALGVLFAFRSRTRRPPAQGQPVSAGPGPAPHAGVPDSRIQAPSSQIQTPKSDGGVS